MAGANRHGVMLQQRFVPFPTSISMEAQAALARLVDDNGIPFNSTFTLPDPEDHDAWVGMKAAVNAQYAASVTSNAGTLQSSVETIKVGDATLHVALPEALAWPECAYIDLHGGALIFGDGDACRAGARLHADQHGIQCYGVDYRMPPEHPYPAALDDCLAAYRYVLNHHLPHNIVIGGRSAGGNLALAMLLRGRDEGLPMPAGLVLLSPEVDLTESGDSFETNQMVDVVLPKPLMAINQLYANGADLAHPYLSPLFGNLAGLPMTFLQSGTRDLLLSSTVRLHRGLRRAGVRADLHVFEAMPHGGFSGGTPEDHELTKEIASFVRASLGP